MDIQDDLNLDHNNVFERVEETEADIQANNQGTS